MSAVIADLMTMMMETNTNVMARGSFFPLFPSAYFCLNTCYVFYLAFVQLKRNHSQLS